MQPYITAINETNDVDTLKAIWWTIGMDNSIWANDLQYLSIKLIEKYNKIK